MEKEKMIKLSIILTLLIYTFGYLGFSYYKYSQPYVEGIKYDIGTHKNAKGEDVSWDYTIKMGFGEDGVNELESIAKEMQQELEIDQSYTIIETKAPKGSYPVARASFKSKGYSFAKYLWRNSTLYKFINLLKEDEMMRWDFEDYEVFLGVILLSMIQLNYFAMKA